MIEITQKNRYTVKLSDILKESNSQKIALHNCNKIKISKYHPEMKFNDKYVIECNDTHVVTKDVFLFEALKLLKERALCEYENELNILVAISLGYC
ncbi:MAG: hypothetical protein LBH55_04405 [Mycoplasmataceae bacterium]|jgi:hypothetical protein|nr:hypothetical protein [Mycoplasmataceae bacterium]